MSLSLFLYGKSLISTITSSVFFGSSKEREEVVEGIETEKRKEKGRKVGERAKKSEG